VSDLEFLVTHALERARGLGARDPELHLKWTKEEGYVIWIVSGGRLPGVEIYLEGKSGPGGGVIDAYDKLTVSPWVVERQRQTTIVKTCSCGRAYTQAEWKMLPLAGNGVYEDDWEVMELRNCFSCKSTMSIVTRVKQTYDPSEDYSFGYVWPKK
jgi:hypothetical protein